MNNRIINNIIKVGIGNIFTLLAGFASGFILPKILGVTDYGYYKMFTLYCSYITILHFGYVDGIYLKFGDVAVTGFDKKSFRDYTKLIFLLEGIVSFILLLISAFAISNSNYAFIFSFVAINILCINCTTYYQVLSQITQNFRELTIRNIIKSLLQIIACVSLLVIWLYYKQNISYKLYLLIYTMIGYFLLIWYCKTYHVIFGSVTDKRISISRNDVLSCIKTGFPLTLSNLTSALILSIDRQFVSILFSTDSFGIYSFAYSILTMATTIISAISVVLYPYLKTEKSEMNPLSYERMSFFVLFISYGFTLLYFPLKYLIQVFLPDYVESLSILLVMMPTLAISSMLSIVCSNYYKASGKTNQFFIQSVSFLFLSLFFNYFAYKFFGTMIAISVASLLTIGFWYVVSDVRLFAKGSNRHWFLCLVRYFFVILVSVLFIGLLNDSNNWYFLLYSVLFIVLSFLYFLVIIKSKNRLSKA